MAATMNQNTYFLPIDYAKIPEISISRVDTPQVDDIKNDIKETILELSYLDSNPPSPASSSGFTHSPMTDDFTDSANFSLNETSTTAGGLGRKVAVLGVGYVGLHLVEEFGKRHNVTAFDVSAARIATIAPGLSSLPLVKPTCNASDLAGAEYYMISVPTLIRADESVDTSYLESAIALIERHASPGSTVIIESSVAIGMTRSLLAPLVFSKGLKGGMSPERVDPGRKFPEAFEIPKVISGLDDIAPGSLDSIKALYETTFNTVVPVSKPEVAEMCKLYENCQRMVNIAYANEMADACIPLGIDPSEVTKAASSKPFGFSPFSHGPGIGGHCIPINPYYLFSTSDFPLLHHATEQMKYRPAQIVDRLMRDFYRGRRLSVTERHADVNVRALVVGAGFKPGQSVLSNSPGLAMMRAFQEHWDADVEFADPLVSQAMVKDATKMEDGKWSLEGLKSYDVIVVAMRQHGLDFDLLEGLEGPMVHFCCP